MAMLFSTPLSDRLGRTRLIVGGWAVYGLFMAATEGAEKALVADLAPKELLGTAYGWFNLTAGVVLLPASLMFGWLWQTFRPETAFGFSAGCAILAAVLLKCWVPTQSAHTTGQLLKR